VVRQVEFQHNDDRKKR
jgi:hypothetical protein